MSLIEHAKLELKKAGLFDKDADYSGWVAESALKLIELFASQRHSGMSAALTRELFSKLANFEVLTPISSDPSEWTDRSEMSGKPFWQNKRDSHCFSEDGGNTWTRLVE